ncbi:MAG: choice-of-anchor J domain-containing protein [Bacteroidales bacterium]|nr:choice-of-anchor J domain-containing protein [Bacteroidales bacterium]
MKILQKSLLIICLFFGASLISNAQIVDLPISVDFNSFSGINLSEINEGWTEGNGYPVPSLGTGSWFAGEILYNTTTASIKLNSGNKDGWIVSPEFNVTNSTNLFFKASVSADYNYPKETELGIDDEFGIYISEDGGSSFTKLLNIKSDLEYNLKPFHVDLSGYESKTIRVGFYASDGQVQNSYACVHLDDIKIKNSTEKDLAVNGFDISQNIELNKELKFNVEVTNEGLNTLNNIPLRIDIRGPENRTEVIVIDENIEVAQTKTIYLTDIKLAAEGKYTIKVSSELVDDADAGNDIFQQEFELIANKEIPLEVLDFKYSYSSVSYYKGWKEAIGDPEHLAYSGSAWDTKVYQEHSAFCAPIYGQESFDWFISPSFIPTQNTNLYFEATLKFLEGTTAMGDDDEIVIYITDDGGLNWTKKASINKDNIDESWKKYFFDLSEYEGDIIKVGFFATSGNTKDESITNVYIDNVSINTVYDYDIKLTDVLEPQKPAQFTSTETIAVAVENLGKEKIENFILSYTVNGGTEIKENVTQSIESQESSVYYFNTKADLTGSDIQISVKAYLDGDANTENNEINNLELNTYSYNPLTEGKYELGFEVDEDFSAWVTIDGNQDGFTWQLHHDESSYDYDGDYTFYYSSKNTTVQSNEWLISNGFYLEAGCEYFMSFYFANRAGIAPEKLKVTMGETQTIAGQNQTLIDLGEISNNSFSQAEKTFTVSSDGFYYFGWNSYGDADQYAMFIDNIVIQKKYNTDLSINRFYIPKAIDYSNNILDSIRTVLVEVENQGELELTEIPLKMEFQNEDENKTFEFTFTQTIAPGEKVKLELKDDAFAFDFSKPIDAKVFVNSSSDEYHKNDTLVKENYMHINYYTSFEYAEETESWIIVDSDEGGHTWERKKDKSKAKTGNYYYGVKTSVYGGYTENIDWLISDGIYLEKSACYKLKFWYANVYSKENLKLFIGNSYDPETFTDKLIDINIVDNHSSTYSLAEIIINVDETGVYYLGFLSDLEINNRYYICIDDFSLEKVEEPTPEFDLSYDLIYKNAVLKIDNKNDAVKDWTWTIDGKVFENVEQFEYVFSEKGEYPVKLEAGNRCVTNMKDETITIDYALTDDFEYTIDDKNVSVTVDNTNLSDVVWNFGDGNFSNEISPINSYADYGTYNIILSLYSVWDSFNIEKEIELKTSTAIEPIEKKDIYLYPNPASTYVNIAANKTGKAYIYNETGVVVKEIELTQEIKVIDISNLKPGIYFVESNEMSVKLIVQ